MKFFQILAATIMLFGTSVTAQDTVTYVSVEQEMLNDDVFMDLFPEPEVDVDRDVLIDLTAKVFYGEFRSTDNVSYTMRIEAWHNMFSALVNRTTYINQQGLTWWDPDLRKTIVFGCDKGDCEIDGLPHVTTEDLLAPVGQEAILIATVLIDRYLAGNFVPHHRGHSWATPEAGAKDSWFQTLRVVHIGPAHKFYADLQSPVSRPSSVERQNLDRADAAARINSLLSTTVGS